jgi:hypothetical protein
LVSNAAKPGTNGIIDVVLSRSFPQTVSVPFAIVSGSATFGSDFTISGVTSGLGAVQIAAGATTAQIVVQPLPAAGAVAESFTLQLLPSADYLLAPQGTSAVNPSASMTISPVPVTTGAQPVYLAIDSVSVNENAGTATVTVRLSDAAGVPLADTLAAGAAVGFTISGTASAGADYTAPVSNSLAMSAATASATIILPILDDNLAENDETITISLNPGPGYQLSSLATGTVTIVDDEPSITIAAPATNPAEGGAVASFTVTASRAVSVATSVAYAVTGTATAGTDYAALSGAIVIPIGQASATVQVSAAADVETDPDETVVLTLLADPLSPATYKLGATTAATAVIDDAVATAIATVTVVATQATATQAPTPVDGALTISAARGVSTSNAELSIPLTVGGTALPGTAYTALPASVTLPELVTTASAPIGAGFLNVQVVGGAPAVLPAGCVLRIGTGGTAETVIVSSETTVGATTTVVPLQAVLAAAWPSGTSIGVSTAVLAVAPLPSAISANGGTVVVSLPASGANWTAGAAPANSGTVTISSGYPRISVALGTTPAEGASGTFTLTSSQTVASATTIAYAISGSATAGADYTAPSGTVVMAAGASQATVSVAILADGVSDPAETLTLTLLIDPGTTPAYQLAASGTAATHTISETATDTSTGGDPKPAPDADASDSGGSCGAGALSGLLIGVLALAGLRRRRR